MPAPTIKPLAKPRPGRPVIWTVPPRKTQRGAAEVSFTNVLAGVVLGSTLLAAVACALGAV